MKQKDFELRENEKIKHTVFHHPIVVVPDLVISLLILILDFFLMYYLFLQGWWGVILFGAVILALAFYMLRLFFLYRKNKFIITNQRIIDFEQAGFFEKFVNEFPFLKIHESKAVIKGIGPTLFRYGNLKLILSQDLGPFELFKIAKPIKLQNIINEYINKAEAVKKPKDGVDPVSMVMAEVELLNKSQKEEVIRQIEQHLSKGTENVL
ncbi:hypothetical protein HQ571_05305 [Candidatus Kuenenbacteria bacterium]|nr:hypothetical protein [Candidatus Kuenenbacteria bacterium]